MPGTTHDPSGSLIPPPSETGGNAGAVGTPDIASEKASAIAEDVIDRLERGFFSDLDAEWAVIRAQVERWLALRSGRPHPAQGADAPPGQSTEGVMPSHPEAAPAPQARRPFEGFDREEAAYARGKPELLRAAEGQYVVFVGEEMVGPVATYGEALRAGYRRFGRGPLYVKRVLAQEPVAEVSRDFTPCRP
jgi:hypothetical protein